MASQASTEKRPEVKLGPVKCKQEEPSDPPNEGARAGESTPPAYDRSPSEPSPPPGLEQDKEELGDVKHEGDEGAAAADNRCDDEEEEHRCLVEQVKRIQRAGGQGQWIDYCKQWR